IEPSLAGPKRPQDRVPLKVAKPMFRAALSSYVEGDSVQNSHDEAEDESFPASDVPSFSEAATVPAPTVPSAANGARGRTSNPVAIKLGDGTECVLDHGAVVIAAITSCTNTSNPSVMIGA